MVNKKLFGFITAFLLLFRTVAPSHNASRYFPFLERPESVVTRGESHIYPSLFITSASTAFKRGGGNTGIPELWGKYDLKNVIDGVEAVKLAQGAASYNPFAAEVGYVDWNEKEVKFSIDGKIKSEGFILEVEQRLFKTDFSLGCFIPLMHVNSSLRFNFDSENSHADVKNATIQEQDMLDRVRRSVHADLALKGSDWSHSGFGDIDLHLRWRHFWDHALKMKSIDFNLQAGLTCPTGVKSEKDYPSSVPFMGNGHWGAYFDLVAELELKQNWCLGIMAGLIEQFKKTNNRRIPYYKEPAIFSALHGNVEINPGITLKLSPYFTLENLTDGLHFQLRYSFLRHSADSWKDVRVDKTVASYLALEKSDITDVRAQKNALSKWTSHYLSMQLIYDSVEAMKNWFWKPTLYAIYDHPMAGRGMCKTHQFSIGVEFHPF